MLWLPPKADRTEKKPGALFRMDSKRQSPETKPSANVLSYKDIGLSG